MRFIPLLCLLLLGTANAAQTHSRFLQQTGITDIMTEFPADIQTAAKRHASRCNSSANTRIPDGQRMFDIVAGRLEQVIPKPAATQLVDWYDSPTGLKVRKLERGEIDEAALQKFAVNSRRAKRIQQIYDSTATGHVLASIAVELEFAGWSLSGCKQKAEQSGDVKLMHREMIHGQVIKKEAKTLEEILRIDTLRSMAYLMSPLSDAELTEYAQITMQHAAIYAELKQSLINAIDLETNKINLSFND